MPKLVRKTKNLIIRPLDAGDYEVWRASRLAHAPPKNRWDFAIPTPAQCTKAYFRKILSREKKQRAKDSYYSLKAFDRKTGAMVGGVSIMEVTRGLSHTCYLGYYIFNSYWGKGLAKESSLAAIDIAFRDLKLHRVEAGIEPSNHRSIKLARAMGMRREGIKKRSLYLRNQWVDLLMYTLTTEDVGIKWKGKLGHLSSR